MSFTDQSFDGGSLDFKFDTNLPLGSLANSGANPAKVGLEDYGIARKAKLSVSLLTPVLEGAGVVFPDTIEDLCWYGVLGPTGILMNQIPRKYYADWYSPDGKLYERQKFRASFWFEGFMKTTIAFKQPMDKTLIGRWRVRVHQGDTLVDDRYFEIVETA